MARYRMADHVFVCRDEEYVVLLDLQRDRYFTFEAARTAALTAALPGWPAECLQDEAPFSGPSPRQAETVAAALLSEGWLLESGSSGGGVEPVHVAAPASELLDAGALVSAPLRWGSVLVCIGAACFASFALCFWSLETIVRRVRRRHEARAAEAAALDVERARSLVELYCRVRVFLFSHHGRCLHDSLSLLEFLARHGIFASWVFGVRARPFAAHCWIQYADIVFNDTVEHSSTYVPIMVI